jgi:hypothetical protein
VVDSGHLHLLDLPASLEKGLKDGGCWRVDDDCRFGVDGWQVRAVLGRPGGQLIFMTFDGAEGQIIQLLQARGGALVELQRAYRYLAPM